MYVIVFGNLDVRHFIIMVFIIGNEYLYLKNFGKVYKFWPVGCIEHPHEKVIRPVRVPGSSWFCCNFCSKKLKPFSLNFSPYVSNICRFYTVIFLFFVSSLSHSWLMSMTDTMLSAFTDVYLNIVKSIVSEDCSIIILLTYEVLLCFKKQGDCLKLAW